MPFICPICEGIYTDPSGVCPHCVSNARAITEHVDNVKLVRVLTKKARLFYPNLSDEEIQIAALEELLAQNRRK